MREEGRTISLDQLPAELRPRPSLLRYYLFASFLAGPFFFIPLVVWYVRYRTLRYRIDDKGISMRWGALSQREIVLNFARIQDIHLTSNVLERWLGLAKIRIQTASGSAKAEMVLEGLDRPDAMRDFLYSRMRGGGEGEDVERAFSRPGLSDALPRSGLGDQALVAVLKEVTAEIRALRSELSAVRTEPEATDERRSGREERSGKHR